MSALSGAARWVPVKAGLNLDYFLSHRAMSVPPPGSDAFSILHNACPWSLMQRVSLEFLLDALCCGRWRFRSSHPLLRYFVSSHFKSDRCLG